LSDIHFTHFLKDHPHLDIERAVRTKLLIDIGRMRQRLDEFDAILVVGDIGSVGDSADYEVATEFIDSVVDLIGCASDKVVCVPGNHDVNRKAHTPGHDAIRNQLRTVETALISDTLLRLIQDESSGRILFTPFDAYNNFALAFGCDISREAPVFAPKTLLLNSKQLYIHGITSAWICDDTDSHTDEGTKIVAGAFQLASLGRDPDAISVTLCHHPPRWLRDSNELGPWTATAQLVLTGHEHEAGIYLSPDRRTVYVSSGAVNPSRSEGAWLPSYNVIELDIDADNPEDLIVTIYARTWQGRRAEFGSDPNRPDPLVLHVALQEKGTMTSSTEADANNVVPTPRPLDSSERIHSRAVMRAPRDRRRRIAREMGLIGDSTSVGLAGDREILREAIGNLRLAELAARLVGDFGYDG
jgi:predicted phosphodiesterase